MKTETVGSRCRANRKTETVGSRYRANMKTETVGSVVFLGPYPVCVMDFRA